MKFRLARLVREPLVHFLLAGAVIFAVWGGGGNEPTDRTITVTEAQVRTLAEQWGQTWHRRPTPAEMDGLISEFVKNEVYYREALRLGLDKDDIIVRRRLRSKMEFLVGTQIENDVPDAKTLQAWLDAHWRDYTTGTILSFDQIYVGEDASKTGNTLARLTGGVDPASLGTSLSVPPRLDEASASDIDRQFGEGFGKLLVGQPLGRWVGPVRSGFGLHLVRVRKVVPSTVPPLRAIRKKVENDWHEANRAMREAKAYQVLLDGYTIRIAKP